MTKNSNTLNGSSTRTRGTPKPSKTSLVNVRQAGPDHEVVSVKTASKTYRREVCGGCPWRCDTVGEFPAEAFVHSAPTAYDMSTSIFSCHEVGAKKPAICAGYLLRGAAHSLSVRLMQMNGQYNNDVIEPDVALHKDYRAMAIANGVDPNHPAIRACRDN